jgi:FkbM family methyltransferase
MAHKAKSVATKIEPPLSSSGNDEVIRQIQMIDAKIDALEGKLERVWANIEFMRNRMSSYLGDGIALTYVQDQTPVFVNANDIGCPTSLINGGRWEQHVLDVFFSFVTDDSVFLDIGANLGFYSLLIGKRITSSGRVHAFEPHPQLVNLMRRSLRVNSLEERPGSKVVIHQFGLADREQMIEFHYPVGHLGGGHIAAARDNGQFTVVKANIKRLDDVMAPDFSCDLVKIDVESHELGVLQGMRRTIANSPKIKIIFENHSRNVARAKDLGAFFSEFGMELYGIRGTLTKLGPRGLQSWFGYVFAARPGVVKDGDKRTLFSVYPAQLSSTAAKVGADKLLTGVASDKSTLFYGPYWFLRRGAWKLKFHGKIAGSLLIAITERYGLPVTRFRLAADKTEHRFAVEHDLIDFECVASAVDGATQIALERLEFVKDD